MSIPLQTINRRWFIVFVSTMVLSSCGEKEKNFESSESVESPEVEPVGDADEFRLLAEDQFRYPNGRLDGNRPPKGFTGTWIRHGDGEDIVVRGVARTSGNTRITCQFDTSPNGPFADYLDDDRMIGKNGTTIYISFFQALTDINKDKVAFVDFLKGDGSPMEFTQFCAGFDVLPAPAGPFGLRVKRDVEQVIAAPDELNSFEHLIVLKIQFREGDMDRIYYYYNPSPSDEQAPDGALISYDLSFDRYGLAAWRGGAMEVRHFRIADNFKAVTIQ